MYVPPSTPPFLSPNLTPSPAPAFEAISSLPLTLTPHAPSSHAHASPYTGYPTPETTAAWMTLMDGYSIRVPSTTLAPVHLQSIPLNDGSDDVWVSLNVYHHLHCLDSIRHQVAGEGCRAADGDNVTAHDAKWFPPHIDHCIETLRRRLVCQPDLGVRAIAWNADKPGVAFANNTVEEACVDWDAVQAWTKAHSFSAEEQLITTPEGEKYRLFSPPPRRRFSSLEGFVLIVLSKDIPIPVRIHHPRAVDSEHLKVRLCIKLHRCSASPLLQIQAHLLQASVFHTHHSELTMCQASWTNPPPSTASSNAEGGGHPEPLPRFSHGGLTILASLSSGDLDSIYQASDYLIDLVCISG